MKIEGASILLTGASGGLGQAIARALSDRGGRLILTGRRLDALQALARQLAGARAVQADLSEPQQLDELLGQAGEVDILIANAALPASGLLESFSVEQIDRALEVNLRAPVVLAHALLPQMRANGHGHIVLISSLAGKAATAGSSLYNATKFGLRGFGIALRSELHGSGVGVSTIMPGFIREAGMFAESGAKLPPGVGTKAPEDVAKAVVDAIERNRGEVDVAPLPLRLGSAFAGLAPGISSTITRIAGGDHVATAMAAGQAAKR